MGISLGEVENVRPLQLMTIWEPSLLPMLEDQQLDKQAHTATQGYPRANDISLSSMRVVGKQHEVAFYWVNGFRAWALGATLGGHNEEVVGFGDGVLEKEWWSMADWVGF
nr:hypothetical protein Iba_chr15eCG7430 [Ipomoea batatas]